MPSNFAVSYFDLQKLVEDLLPAMTFSWHVLLAFKCVTGSDRLLEIRPTFADGRHSDRCGQVEVTRLSLM